MALLLVCRKCSFFFFFSIKCTSKSFSKDCVICKRIVQGPTRTLRQVSCSPGPQELPRWSCTTSSITSLGVSSLWSSDNELQEDIKGNWLFLQYLPNMPLKRYHRCHAASVTAPGSVTQPFLGWLASGEDETRWTCSYCTSSISFACWFIITEFSSCWW